MLPLVVLLVQAQTVSLTPFFDDGGTTTHDAPPALLPLAKAGGKMSTVIRVGAESFRVWVDLASEGTMFVDRNHNNRPDKNEQIPVKRKTQRLPDGATLQAYQAEFSVVLGGGGKAKFVTRVLTSDTKDPGFADVRNRLAVMPQFGYLGKASFGGKSYRIGIRGGNRDDGVLFVDRDGDGVLGSVPAEMYPLAKPFSIGGKTYRLSMFQPGPHARVAFATSSQRVAEQPMPPDFREGKIVPSWSGPTLTGKTIKFPSSFPGKIVLLDIWATWCAPCRGEIPFMKAVYAKYRKRGFEIVSYSVDDPNMRQQVAAFSRQAGTNWTQVYEGKARGGGVYAQYAIEAIPFMLLVDGSTGRILASGDILRGPNMDPTIGGILAMRGR